MRGLRVLVLAGAVAWAGAAEALPGAAPMAGRAGPAVERVQLVCGPYRCFARPFWHYRSGAGFRPFRPFGFVPARRFRPMPFGFGRFRRF